MDCHMRLPHSYAYASYEAVVLQYRGRCVLCHFLYELARLALDHLLYLPASGRQTYGHWTLSLLCMI